jgi:hypothetical protein
MIELMLIIVLTVASVGAAIFLGSTKEKRDKQPVPTPEKK